MVEAVVFLTLVVMGMVALSHTSLTVHQLQNAEDKRSIAMQGLISVVEDVRRASQEFVGDEDGWAQAFSDAYAAGGAPGSTFVIPGLDPVAAQPTVGTVTVITDETLSDADIEFELGMPMDLDNDGAVSDADVRDSAQLLPVIVRVRWQSPMGVREVSQGLLLLGV